MVRVDLHVHTMWSGDSTTTPEELAESVQQSGVDVLCITDHGTIDGAVRLAQTGELGCRVVVGQEVGTAEGEIIGLFLTERVPPGLPPRAVARAIRDQGGLVYVPHPFDDLRRALSPPAMADLAGEGLIDAVEVLNAKTSLASASPRAASFAAAHGLIGGAGSDAHVPDAVGAAYLEMADFDGAASFAAAARAGAVVGHHYDAARPWRPRIVPSTRNL
jgi:predicted metal-dependent phosphoesterase TrpH